MRTWEEAKKRYEETPISDQLNERVAQTIQSARMEQTAKAPALLRRKRFLQWGAVLQLHFFWGLY